MHARTLDIARISGYPHEIMNQRSGGEQAIGNGQRIRNPQMAPTIGDFFPVDTLYTAAGPAAFDVRNLLNGWQKIYLARIVLSI